MAANEIRIAIIDDDEDDFLLIRDFINEIGGKEFIIDWFRDYKDASEQLRLKDHHLYFVDYFLGTGTGLDLLRDAAALNFDRPIILLTGLGNREIDIRAMKNGATDYLVKADLTAEKLERCIRYSLERAHFFQELKARETRYRKLFEGSKDAVFLAGTDLIFIEINKAAALLLEPSNGSFSGASLYDFIEDEIQKQRIRDLVRTAGKIDDLEIKLKKENREGKICLLSLYVLKNGEQPVVHGIMHDITGRKKAELANLQAEKLAANERLVRMLAHEIRNPLNNVLLSAEHLIAAGVNPQHTEYLKIIERNAGRINKIINELLNVAGSASEMIFKNHCLQDMLDESLDLAIDRIKLNKIKVEKNYPDHQVMVPADRGKLVIAFTNILINAVEAMPVSDGCLSIRLDSLPESYNISIKDNGPGIPAKYISKLFEPFFTLKKNGTGLGLTASYGIIQSHKANVHIESTEGIGTDFLITFNKIDAAAENLEQLKLQP